MPENSLRPLRIPTRTHVLGNGMRIIAHEDHSSPVVNVHLMYHVGSKDESPGRTGLAHLLEHLLFEGSEHCPKGEFDLLLERVGGTNNGSTWLDRTNYYETVPSHAVELALWLERERMAHFRPVMGEEMLELQRGVVINERLQVIENRPYGRADEKLHEVLFPEAHPYRWPTIGYLADLESIALEDVRSFHEAYYTPANAVLVLAGDISAEEAFALAERYFGDLPGPSEPRRVAPARNGRPAHGPQREVLEDRVSFPRVYRAHAVPPYGTADWLALDVLAYLLADGESSRLQRALVREGQLAQEVDSYLFPTELNGIFGVVATARSGVEADALEETIDRTLTQVIEEGVTEAEVAGAVRRVRRDQVEGLANVEDRAEALAYAATVLGEAEALERVMDGY
ncbi:MAG TPA: pitrilysin family protein, partial [Longimicrobiaceae bacterium]|nr:pitrilysin family protein [Longimicrobiaceae bacterium]